MEKMTRHLNRPRRNKKMAMNDNMIVVERTSSGEVFILNLIVIRCMHESENSCCTSAKSGVLGIVESTAQESSTPRGFEISPWKTSKGDE
jgi:hypothetical protein